MPDAIGIVGTDGYTPVYQPDARWTTWSIHEIYQGQVGQNKFIPKVNDYVVEPESAAYYKVTNLSSITLIPELTPINFNQSTLVIDNLISSTDDNYRCYFDKSVTPFTLSVDSLLKIYSSTSSFARIYKGQFIDPTKIISRRYDNSNNFIGSDIPLQLVAFNTHDNYAIKSVPACNTTEDLMDGEVVTIVIYDSSSRIISKRTLLIEETTFIAQAFNEQKYITQIFIKSPFINVSNPSEITYPVNLPLVSFNPIGVVQYNDGSQIEYPVDGDKFRLYGLDQFISSIIGHKVPLVLSYRLDANESALATVTTDNSFATRPYNLTVSNPNTSYNVKLFIYPVWVDNVNGYIYKAYLLNLDRNIIFEVTSLLTLASNSATFNPLAYGVTQRLLFTIDLANVSGIYNHFMHVQTVDIILRAPATESSSTNIWEVSNQVPTSVPYYGTNLRAIRNNTVHNKVTIENNATNLTDWLNKLYYSTQPLFNPMTEEGPIAPSHIELKYGVENIIVPIEEYNNEFMFNNSLALYTNLDIIFLRQYPNSYLKLSVASICIR
ncbi:MAG: Virion structural protein [uncultured bacterium]|nr:MAG: Virion structural protein [uncultured bacterium]